MECWKNKISVSLDICDILYFLHYSGKSIRSDGIYEYKNEPPVFGAHR